MFTYNFEYPDIMAMPAPRPRYTKHGRVFMPPRYEAFKRLMQELTAKQLPYYFIYITSPCYVSISVSKTISTTSRNFGDTDNLAKSILDAFNGIVYDDDKRVTVLNIKKIQGTRNSISVTVTAPELEIVC